MMAATMRTGNKVAYNWGREGVLLGSLAEEPWDWRATMAAGGWAMDRGVETAISGLNARSYVAQPNDDGL